MTKKQYQRARQICQDVILGMEADATAFDGKPLNGKIVAEYFGNQGAAIAALANVLDRLLEAQVDAYAFEY